MEELRLGDQTIRYDRDATAMAYRMLATVGWKRCACDGCLNFVQQKEVFYPSAFLALLNQLGVDPNRESDVHQMGIVENGICPYGGWFYLVGELMEKGEGLAEVAENFQCFFRAVDLTGSKVWAENPVLAIEFMTKIRWLSLEDPTS